MKSFPTEIADRFRAHTDLARAAARQITSPTHTLDAFQHWTRAAQIASDLTYYYAVRQYGLSPTAKAARMANEWKNTHIYASAQAGHAAAVLQGQEREVKPSGEYASPEESAEWQQRAEEQRKRSEATFAALAAHYSRTPQPREEQSV